MGYIHTGGVLATVTLGLNFYQYTPSNDIFTGYWVDRIEAKGAIDEPRTHLATVFVLHTLRGKH